MFKKQLNKTNRQYMLAEGNRLRQLNKTNRQYMLAEGNRLSFVRKHNPDLFLNSLKESDKFLMNNCPFIF